MFNQCRPAEAIERYAGDPYTQHNPHVGDGKEAFIAYFERMAREYPASGSSSCGSSRRATRRAALPPGLAGRRRLGGIDIFRLDAEGKVVEHWDVLQVVPEQSANGNGMF